MTVDTQALVPVHVFGNGCNVEALEAIAHKHGLKTIYDAAHAFGVNYKGSSLLQQGDASTLSFHATKLFHSIEGGAIIFKRKEDLELARLLINFGIDGPDSVASLGINAKMNEFEAAMGLCMLDDVDMIIAARDLVVRRYQGLLASHLIQQQWNPDCSRNFAYFPVLLNNEKHLLRMKAALNDGGINTRRYFHPSLDTLGYVQPVRPMTVSRDIAGRILCLPVSAELTDNQVRTIARIILKAST